MHRDRWYAALDSIIDIEVYLDRFFCTGTRLSAAQREVLAFEDGSDIPPTFTDRAAAEAWLRRVGRWIDNLRNDLRVDWSKLVPNWSQSWPKLVPDWPQVGPKLVPMLPHNWCTTVPKRGYRQRAREARVVRDLKQTHQTQRRSLACFQASQTHRHFPSCFQALQTHRHSLACFYPLQAHRRSRSCF